MPLNLISEEVEESFLSQLEGMKRERIGIVILVRVYCGVLSAPIPLFKREPSTNILRYALIWRQAQGANEFSGLPFRHRKPINDAVEAHKALGRTIAIRAKRFWKL